jgi:betaine-homocysteine S-methyltransferase
VTAFPGTATLRGPALLDRLAVGSVICAEGYLFELERRGYLQAGAFVPEVVLDHPEQASVLHEQFVHAGSEVAGREVQGGEGAGGR